MPGAYATALENLIRVGRWPGSMLHKMLYRDTLTGNHPNWQLNTFIHGPNLPSCHPTAIRFMNVIHPGLFPGDDVFGLGDGKIGVAAQGDVDAAVLAANQNDQAIWVRYGGSNGHSFVLLTGHANTVESFEAWAAGHGGYWFNQSVINEPDLVGHPRQDRNLVSTRAAIAVALQDLLDPNLVTRTAAVDIMSRAGVGGFGNNALGANVPGLDIHVTPSQGLAGVIVDVRQRLIETGHICAYTRYRSSGDTVYACCRCQGEVVGQAAARTARWRECGTCTRRYCRQCKHLLASRNRFSRLLQTRVRICDCNADTARI
jgi:hypothetical protein